MVPTIVISINLFLLAAIIIASAALGFLTKTAQLKKKSKRILELEQEMLSNHARILELERQLATITKRSEKWDPKNLSAGA